MRILAIADVEERWLGSGFKPGSLDDVDLIISCGDLPGRYLSRLADYANKPIAYVPGNHDSAYAEEEDIPGCINLDGHLRDFHGLRLMGLGGSVAYNGSVYGFTEAGQARRAARMMLLAQASGGVDLVVAHVPPAGYGDMPDFAHTGFECFNTLLERLQPTYMLHGHIHRNYGRIAPELVHPAGTRIINCCGHTYLDIPDAQIPERKARRFFGVDAL